MVTVGPPQLTSECLLVHVPLLTSILPLLELAETWYPALQMQPKLQKTSKDISRAKWRRTSCKQNQDLKCQQIAVWTCHGRKQLGTCWTTTALNWASAMCNYCAEVMLDTKMNGLYGRPYSWVRQVRYILENRIRKDYMNFTQKHTVEIMQTWIHFILVIMETIYSKGNM